MTDDDRRRIATMAVRGMSDRCDRVNSSGRCAGKLRMTGLFQPGATAPTIMIRCSVCDTYKPEDDA